MTYLENERAQVLLVHLETFQMVRFSKRKVEYKYCHYRNARPISEQVTLLIVRAFLIAYYVLITL
jgi:hypothetical protein